MRSFDQGSTRASRESVAAGNDPKGEALAPSNHSPCLFRYPSFIFTSSATAALPDDASLIRPTKSATNVESCNMPLPDGAPLIGPTKPAPNVESCNMPLPDGAPLIGPTKPAPNVESCNMPLPDGAPLIGPTKLISGSASCHPVGRIRRSRHPAHNPHRAENKKPCRGRVFHCQSSVISDGRGQSGIYALNIPPARSRYAPGVRTERAQTASCRAPDARGK